jgi:hypothetical protein
VKAYYDLRQAAALDDAGIKNLEINTFANTGWPEDKVTLQLLQADWAKIGIKLNFSEIQTSQYYDRRFSGDFEFLLWFNARALRDPYIFLGTQSEITGRGVPFGIPNPTLDKLTQDGAIEVDPEKRRKIYQETNSDHRRGDVHRPCGTHPAVHLRRRQVRQGLDVGPAGPTSSSTTPGWTSRTCTSSHPPALGADTVPAPGHGVVFSSSTPAPVTQ